MMAGLLDPSADFRWEKPGNSRWEDRFSDLELEHLLRAMAGADDEIARVCRQVMDTPLQSREALVYRQEILRDFLAQPRLARQLYGICRETEEKRRGIWYRLSSSHASAVYASASDLLKIYMEGLVSVRRLTEGQAFSSAGLRRFAQLLSRELSEDYLSQLQALESGIREGDGILIRSGFGSFLQGTSYTKLQNGRGLSSLQWLVMPSWTIAEQDTSGAEDLGIRRDRAISTAADAMAQAADNLQHFTDQLRKELAFYVGALNLYEQLRQLGLPVCFPVFTDPCRRLWEELYDGSLALLNHGAVVGNTLESTDKLHYLITGANQGGKTTFLRSVGQCQLMAQCGMFVCARRCHLPLRSVIYTHFKREEQAGSGKLDEELGRMSRIIDGFRSGGMLLSNESFSSTNDPDGSELLSQITRALLARQAEVFTVTHLVNFSMSRADQPQTLCLRAERRETGERSFRLIPGRPLRTAFGEDLYRRIFSGEEPSSEHL